MAAETPRTTRNPDHPWLRSLGLHRRELRAWALYDWANSAFATTMMAAILPIYYVDVAAREIEKELRVAYWSDTQVVALVIIALISPVLGAAADFLGAKKRFLAGFASLGVIGSLLLYFVQAGDWLFASAAFVVGNVGFAGGNVFYESLLPHVARPDEIDRVSTAGYALGYLGGGLLLTVQIVAILAPQRFGLENESHAARAAFASVALWWAVFTLPILRTVREPPRRLASDERVRMDPIRAAVIRVLGTFREIRAYRQAFVFLLAFWCYNDGINTIIKMAAAFGTEIGIPQAHLLGAILLVQFLGIPCAFAYGLLADRIGSKRGIYLGLWVYTAISGFAYFMTEAWHFWILACGVALVQGGTQALSRSLFARLIPAGKSSQFFGFYSVSGKFGNVFGPALFSIVNRLSGGSRLSIVALVVFFFGGMFLLSRVDVEAGQRAAAAEDEELRVVAPPA